jgi:chromosome segregation protein
MFVKSLRLAGFKSFADPTILEFEPGVNVIVGPNGSGKSNIADGLAWVLGSQAPSSMRGGSMEDVIFAGSESRLRLGIAEVRLTLDNSSGILPIDVSEVTISRSTDRTGASEYRINGAPCRLLDITELLSDTGIGRSLHTVVGQGQIDAVLNARPEDRRSFIEEAAQIGKYRRRKDRSLRKIERVDENLVRLNDVLVELRRAIRPLKRQASAAAHFSELLSEHTQLRRKLTATEIHRLEAEGARFDPEVESHRVNLLTEELSTIRARLESSNAERERLTGAAEKTQRVAHGIGRAADRLASLHRLAEERAATYAARLSAETEEGYRERIRLLETESQRWSGESARSSTEAETARSSATAAAEASRAERESLDDADRRLAEARAAETSAAQIVVRAEGSAAAGKATIGSIEARVHAAQERRDVTARDLQEDQERIRNSENEVRSLEAELDTIATAAAESEARLEQAREKTDDLRRQMEATHAEKAAAQARLDTLREVVGMFPNVQQVGERLEPLIAHAGEHVRIATIGEDEAHRILAAAEERVEQIWIEVGKHDDELRRLDALTAGAAERLVGARRRYESRESELAARDEELSRSQEALATAERTAAEERARLPEQRAALDEARRLREALESELRSARQKVDEAQRRASDAEIAARGLEERALAAQLRVEEAQAGIADAHAALEGLAGRRAALQAARRRAERVAEIAYTAHGSAAVWAQQAEVRAQRAREDAREAERRLAQMRARERELDDKLEELIRVRNDAEVRRAQTQARVEALVERAMDEWGMGLDALKLLESFRPEEETEARERAEKLDRDMRRLGAVNPRASEEYEELAEREKFLVDQIEDLKRSRGDLMKIVRDVDDTIIQVFGDAFQGVADEFEGVFERLFPGGRGRLKLTNPDDLLTTGIDIEAQPPGKNVKKLSLLSGGERSLVALAFLFSIFRSKPSPFYLLDEVEAALDDLNLSRFIGLVDELEERAQILVVTHQKRTMEAADVLYGVSMGKNGVSNVVAKRMEEVAR